MKIENVFVAGCGTMGNGIAQACAQSGYTVTMYDISADGLQKAMGTIKKSITKLVEKELVSGTVDEILGRIQPTEQAEAAADADLIIEAVFEKIEIKNDLFAKLNPVIRDTTIVGSNTSGLTISQMAAATKRPENFLGLHFFNPVPLMKAVEVIKGITTSETTFQTGKAFVESLGKEPILVTRDIAGFVLNRINMLTNMEAMRLVENNVATPEDIDKGACLAFGRKMGPLETSDLVGLDVQLMAYTNVYEEEKDLRFYPPSILRRKVAAGHLGRKTGIGWYEYNADGSRKK
ncbi:3-hydroxyacyl-CoA dehydrogenase family protein [Desulfosarcina sp. OttesenSCG-928-A07]|nr:3-hydroxyacyl-CoA dehydrogenase family protein [Desulfosarcina sp. OttesenSCG-928-G17]MDL2328972.1 3-hydroxyacyl-CoA dehydrogenase family protein [Desulfosarcina sp. OttesenSCG-928-A07]